MKGLIIIIIAFVVYFIPSIIANARKKSKYDAILAMNFVFGWTVIGWFVALFWSMLKDKE